MILRLLLIVAAIVIVLSFVQRAFGPQRAPGSSKLALQSAFRKTAYTLAALIFGLGMLFGLWHAWRNQDETATIVAMVCGPLTAICIVLAIREDRRKSGTDHV